MTELQRRLLDLMDYFHQLCKKEGFKYYVLGGTALGTARHGGFIPWDDDLDVGMPRPDYERLKEWCKRNDTGKYLFEYPGEAKDFVYPFGKLYDTTTTLVENTRYVTKRGIYIDIFPLDGVGNSMDESLDKFRQVDKLINLLSTKVCAIRPGRKLYKNIAIVAMRCIPDFILSQYKLMKKIEESSQEYSYDQSLYIANFCGNWHEKEIAKKEWFGEPVECDFETIKVMGQENMDAYLTALYGDWRTPPPIEKQLSHHDYLELDLNTPYRHA